VPDGIDSLLVVVAVRDADRPPPPGHVRMAAKTLQNHIRRLRFEHKEMTQQELADKIGVTRQTVNAIELGKYSPSLEVAFQIADAFGVPLDEVFQYGNSTRRRT
jgi:putative transcriptional regulator